MIKCKNCNNEINLKVASKIFCKNCKVLTNITNILTVQCDKCKRIMQIPVSGDSILSVKPDE